MPKPFVIRFTIGWVDSNLPLFFFLKKSSYSANPGRQRSNSHEYFQQARLFFSLLSQDLSELITLTNIMDSQIQDPSQQHKNGVDIGGI